MFVPVAHLVVIVIVYTFELVRDEGRLGGARVNFNGLLAVIKHFDIEYSFKPSPIIQIGDELAGIATPDGNVTTILCPAFTVVAKAT